MNLNGAPPEGHDRQCHAKSRVTKNRCRRWALTGRDYCQFHGGRRSLAQKSGMPRHYTKHLGQTLRSRIEELTNEAHYEQVQLYEELALTRVILERAVVLAEPALMNGNMEPKIKVLAMAAMGEAIDGVKELVLAAAKLENDARDKVSIRVLDLFVLQVLRAIYRACDDPEVALKIEEEMQSSISLPSSDQNLALPATDGTSLTPDEVVREMDETIGG